MTSILERLKAKQQAVTPARPLEQQVKAGQVIVHGTGITKRMIERGQKAIERETEKSINADQSKAVKKAEQAFTEGLQATLEEIRKSAQVGEIQLDESQIAALGGILENQYSVLIGAAGTGKTTLERIIIEQLAKRVPVIDRRSTYFISTNGEEKQRERIRADKADGGNAEVMPSISVSAYTGRATQQSRRALGEEMSRSVSTIHKLLEYAPTFEEVDYQDPITKQWGVKERRIFRPTFGESMKLPYTVFIFDEASMIPIPLWNEFIAATHPTSRIILIGDIHQLPPIYGKSVLGYALSRWPVFELKTIHRQAAGNSIIANAHRVLNGRPLENAANFHMIGNNGKNIAPSGQNGMMSFVLQTTKKLADMGRFDPYKDVVIVPQNKGLIGQVELNTHFVMMFNNEIIENGIVINKRINIHTGTDHKIFAIRDKVMITSNINTVDPPITNGMIGIVESINLNGRYDQKRSQVADANDTADDNVFGEEIDLDMEALDFALESEDEKDKKKQEETDDQRQSSHVMTIRFETGQTFAASTAGDYRRVQHAYAVTCHKMQGGECPNIIVVVHSANSKMLCQEWLYTALTRARNNVYLLCNERGLSQALARQKIKGDTLAQKIQSYIIETKSDDETIAGSIEEAEAVDRAKFPVLWPARKLEN